MNVEFQMRLGVCRLSCFDALTQVQHACREVLSNRFGNHFSVDFSSHMLVISVAHKRVSHEHEHEHEVRGGTKTKCYPKENQSEFSETRRRKDLVKEQSEFDSVTLNTPAKTVVRRRSSRARSMSQSESSNRSSRCKCHCRFWKRPSQR